MRYCIYCGNNLEEGDRFCVKCGNPVPDSDSVQMRPGGRPAYQGSLDPTYRPEPEDSRKHTAMGGGLHYGSDGGGNRGDDGDGSGDFKSKAAVIIAALAVLFLACILGFLVTKTFLHKDKNTGSGNTLTYQGSDSDSSGEEKQAEDGADAEPDDDGAADKDAADDEDAKAEEKAAAEEAERKREAEEKAAAEEAERKREAEEKAAADIANKKNLTGVDDPAELSQGGAGTDGSYILSDSDKRKYSRSELSSLDDYTLQMAINELYARHGRKFDTPEIQEYFNNKSWYKGTIAPKDFDSNESSYFNQFEKSNKELMAKIRDERAAKKTP